MWKKERKERAKRERCGHSTQVCVASKRAAQKAAGEDSSRNQPPPARYFRRTTTFPRSPSLGLCLLCAPAQKVDAGRQGTEVIAPRPMTATRRSVLAL